jgi:DHA2 family multidrug resistance protein
VTTVTSCKATSGRRVIIVAALLAAYVQAVNISLPNAALRHIQGSLSMADDEVGWVFSSYIAASILSIPLAGWLASKIGWKVVLQTLIAIFTIGLLLAAQATTPIQFVAARVVQGGASGPLGPLSLGILLEVVSPPRHARISQVWTVVSVLGIVSGPSIGGWLSEYHGWHSIFYFSLPIVGFIALAVALHPTDKKVRTAIRFDFVGLASFSTGVIGLQMLLDRGERLEWFYSPEIYAEALIAGLGAYIYLVHTFSVKSRFLARELFRDRNFVIATIMFFAVGFVLLPTMALTSPLLYELLNYPADTTGYVAIPRSLALIGGLVLTTCVPARFDFRLLVAGGLVLVTYGNWQMLGYSPAMDVRPVVTAGLFQGVGLGILLPALTRAAFSTLDPSLRSEGTTFFNLSRLYGSTIGIALVQTFFYSNTQAVHGALAKNLTPHHVAIQTAGLLAGPKLAVLNKIVTGQAAFIGVIGQFKLLMAVILLVSPLVFFLRKPPSPG